MLPVLILLSALNLTVSTVNASLPDLPSDTWANIIKQSDINPEALLRLRGSLQMVSKPVRAQQPELEQLGVLPADVETLVWSLDPKTKKKTLGHLSNLHVNYQTTDLFNKNPSETRSVELIKKNYAHKLITQLIDMQSLFSSSPTKITTDPAHDALRAACLSKPFLDITKRSGELTYALTKNHYDDAEGRKRMLLWHTLDNGDSPNYQDSNGNTTLHEATEWYPNPGQNTEKGLVERLLEKGADLTQVHPKHGNGFDYIINKSSHDFLLQHGGKLENPYGLDRKYVIECRAKTLTDGQKLIAAGASFSPSSTAVPQLLNAHLPDDRQLSERQIQKLSGLKMDAKIEYLRMNQDQARAYENKMNERCTVL